VAENKYQGEQQAYYNRRRALVRELEQVLIKAGKPKDRRSAAQAVKAACAKFGYKCEVSPTTLGGTKELTDEEENYSRPSLTIASYLACAFAAYGPPAWSDNPDTALQQVYDWLLYGSLKVPPDADPSRFEKRPQFVKLDPINPLEAVEPAERIRAIREAIEVASPAALLEYNAAAAQRFRELVMSRSIEAEAQPCDPECPLAVYLAVKKIVSSPATPDEAQKLAEGAGIAPQRMTRLLCGDMPTDGEIAAIEEYGNLTPGVLQSFLAPHIAARRC
jgi:hypothetical protein